MFENLFLVLGPPWLWLSIGLILLVLEIVVPGVVFLWLGFAAIVVGISVFVIDLSWQSQIILFGCLSLISVIAGRILLHRYRRDHYN